MRHMPSSRACVRALQGAFSFTLNNSGDMAGALTEVLSDPPSGAQAGEAKVRVCGATHAGDYFCAASRCAQLDARCRHHGDGQGA